MPTLPYASMSTATRRPHRSTVQYTHADRCPGELRSPLQSSPRNTPRYGQDCENPRLSHADPFPVALGVLHRLLHWNCGCAQRRRRASACRHVPRTHDQHHHQRHKYLRWSQSWHVELLRVLIFCCTCDIRAKHCEMRTAQIPLGCPPDNEMGPKYPENQPLGDPCPFGVLRGGVPHIPGRGVPQSAAHRLCTWRIDCTQGRYSIENRGGGVIR